MRVPVGSYLVPCGRNLADNLWMLLCDISKDKEGRPGSRCLENAQEPAACRDHSIFVAVPFGMWNLETLIPIFKINGQGIDNGFHSLACAQSINSRCQSSNIKSVHN